MLFSNPYNFNQIIMTQSQMEDIMSIAYKELNQEICLDSNCDDLCTAYEDNIVFSKKAAMIIHTILSVILLIFVGYFLAKNLSIFYFLLIVIPMESILLYRTFTKYTQAKAIASCLHVIKNENPYLFQKSHGN